MQLVQRKQYSWYTEGKQCDSV